MYSLKHLAAQKLPRDTCACQPVRFVCKNIYGEMKKELKKLQEERKKQGAVVDELYNDYVSAINPDHEDFLDEYADKFENASTGVCTQYNELETSNPPMDHDEWYAYIEFIASRVADACQAMPRRPNYRYMVAMGIKAMTDAMKAPEGEPCAAMAPVVQTIRRLIDINNKFIKQYDAKYSFEVVEKKQKKYGKALHEWETKVRPDSDGKIDFCKNVIAAVRPICSCRPNICKKT